MSWVKKEIPHIDDYWTVKSQLQPDLEKELGKMQETIYKFEHRAKNAEEKRRGCRGLELRSVRMGEEHIRKDWTAE